ncbi:MAG: response regulator transcription factor, partial [Clostridiales bacterium]|nr:response regulator transcription factor [Clostridiales bacterium]
DHVKKPYSLSVLLAKVKVNLKRLEQSKNIDHTADRSAGPDEVSADKEALDAGLDVDLKLDPGTMSALLDGRRIELKAKEYALLGCLYKHHDTIVKKEVLFDEVWGDSFFSDSTLNVHIRKLREKLEADPNEPALIKTVWGTGYYLKLRADS